MRGLSSDGSGFAPHRAVSFSRDQAPGATDEEVMALAGGLGMILVTEDVGFGRLTFQRRLVPRVGIILIALHPMPRNERADHLSDCALDALARATGGAFVSIGPHRVRARRFPNLA